MTAGWAAPLDGVLVVALEQAVAVPFATRQLADLGARVVKIERPGVGDFARAYDRTVHGESSHFVWLNRGKESVELDVKDPDDRAVLDALLGRADVFVANLGPGAVDRLGLDAATLRGARPELVHCTLSGYGTSGPARDKRAYDLLVQCESGLVSVTGTADEPSRAGISAADIAAGMYVHSGILAALLRRGRTGEGATLEVSLLDALAEWMTQPALFSAYAGGTPLRTGSRHPSIAPYGPFACGDGRVVYVAVQNDREWARLCEHVLGRPELATDPRFAHNPERLVHRAELEALVTATFSGLTADEVESRLDAAGVANARLRSAADLLRHPQLVARDRWGESLLPDGVTSFPALRPPVAWVGEDEPPLRAVPALGSHNETLRREVDRENTGG